MSSNNDYGWVGFDLDGTLAEYHGWISASHIGKPVPIMVELVKNILAHGKKVKILTARASLAIYPDQAEESIIAIQAWCQEHIGQVLEITCEKDQGMMMLYDDRCVQVLPNTGMSIGGALTQLLTGIEVGAVGRHQAMEALAAILEGRLPK